MLQREIVRFRASDTQPNPLEVDYWIDVTSNYYGGCIRYYRNDTNTWEMLDLNDKQVDAIIDYINNALDQIEQFINDSITEIRNELAEFKDELKEEVNKLWQYINQKVEELTTADNNLQSQINELKQLITKAQGDIDTHAARRDNPHVVTRAQLSLATTDNVVFNKVSAPSGFFKE